LLDFLLFFRSVKERGFSAQGGVYWKRISCARQDEKNEVLFYCEHLVGDPSRVAVAYFPLFCDGGREVRLAGRGEERKQEG
jgi:hypothetical protein